MQPITLTANQPRRRFYKGGRQIAQFRGLTAFQEFTPEDWVGSTTAVFGEAPVGLTVLPDDRVLAEIIAEDPLPWLGPAHVARWGTDTMLLVKLLDAGQRLPVHAHPDDEFAATHLGLAHGKAEAWYILRPGTIHLGLKNDLDTTDFLGLIDRQDTAAMLGALHAIDVEAGDSVFVPSGTLHAIGEGTLLVEVQQPTDLSILVEWRGFEIDGRTSGHLGLGFDAAIRAITLAAMPPAALRSVVRRSPGIGPSLAEPSGQFFGLDLADASSGVQSAGFAIAVAHRGPAVLQTRTGELVEIVGGSTTLIPHAFGDYQVSGGTVLLAKPPVP